MFALVKSLCMCAVQLVYDVYAFERQMKYDGEKICIYENWLGNGLMLIDRFETFLLRAVSSLQWWSELNPAQHHRESTNSGEHIYLFHESITGNGCFQCWLLAIWYRMFATIIYTYSRMHNN